MNKIKKTKTILALFTTVLIIATIFNIGFLAKANKEFTTLDIYCDLVVKATDKNGIPISGLNVVAFYLKFEEGGNLDYLERTNIVADSRTTGEDGSTLMQIIPNWILLAGVEIELFSPINAETKYEKLARRTVLDSASTTYEDFTLLTKDELVVAEASCDSTSAKVGQSIKFTGSASKGLPPYKYHWDFKINGDLYRQIDDESNPEITFNNPGLYTATLTVKDSLGYSATAGTSVVITKTLSSPKLQIFEKILIKFPFLNHLAQISSFLN